MSTLPIATTCGCACTTQILVCRCAKARLIPSETIAGLDDALSETDVDIVFVDDLCGLAADRDSRLAALCASGPLHIAACYPRAVRWLLHSAGVEVEGRELVVYNLRERQASEVMSELERSICAREDAGISHLEREDDWAPWYPVIDYERCDSCGQCASFCIFGVYRSREDGEVEVAHPTNCKNNCPACARICPRGAIIFPKIAESPLNGDEVTDESMLQSNVQINVQQLLGEDPRAALVARRAKAQRRLVRKQALDLARAERCACTQAEDTQRPPCEVQALQQPCCDGGENP